MVSTQPVWRTSPEMAFASSEMHAGRAGSTLCTPTSQLIHCRLTSSSLKQTALGGEGRRVLL